MSKYKYYVYDIGAYIKARALEARGDRDSATDENERLFQTGRLIAFNEIISIMQQQARGMDISFEDLQLHDIEPDRDLV